MGKDTTHDMDYIKSLKPGDTSEVGYEGLPQVPRTNRFSIIDGFVYVCA